MELIEWKKKPPEKSLVFSYTNPLLISIFGYAEQCNKERNQEYEWKPNRTFEIMRHINHKFIKFIPLYFNNNIRNTIKSFHSCFPSVWVIHQFTDVFCMDISFIFFLFFSSFFLLSLSLRVVGVRNKRSRVDLVFYYGRCCRWFLCRWYSFLINYMGNRIQQRVWWKWMWYMKQMTFNV